MKSYIFVILLFLHSFSALAQTSFEYILHDTTDHLGGDMIEDTYGNVFISVTNNQYAKLIKLNNVGILVDSVNILNPANGICELFHLLIVDENKFMAFGRYNTDSTFNLWVVTFDYDLNIIEEVKIPVIDDIWPIYQYAIINFNGNVVVFSTYGEMPVYSRVMLHEISTNGSLLKEKTFDGNAIASDIVQLPSSEYRFIVFGHVERNLIKMYSVDTNFVLLDTYVVPWDLDFHNTIKYVDDTNLLITGKKIFPDNERDLGIVKTDFNNNLISYGNYGKPDTFDYPAVHSNLDFISENDIYYGGISNLDLSNPYFSHMPSWFFLNKTDSNLNLKWQKFYGGDACYFPWAILATQDGGCIMAGTRYDYKTQTNQERDIYVLKVDEGGLITWSQVILLDKQSTTVYPNPGTNLLNIKSNNKELDFELINMNGQVIIKQIVNNSNKTINTESLQSGMYSFRLINKKHKTIETGKWIKK